MPRVLAYYASRDLIPLYAVYALLFADHNLSVGQISSLFIVWSAMSFLFEVPSGAWADTVDRRLLLVVSGLVYAVGFSSWLVWPSYAGFLLGFVLWGLSSALMSGTFEALLYDELVAQRRAVEYPRINGWCHATAMGANLAATLAAAPLFAMGGYGLVGWSSVAIALAHAALAWSLPAAARVEPADETADVAREPGVSGTARGTFLTRYRAMLAAGLAEAARSRRVGRAIIVVASLLGLTVYDEYFPLVAREHDVATDRVALLIGIVVLGQFVGTALAGRAARLQSRTIGLLAGSAVVLIGAGALSGHWAGFLGIAVGYGLANNVHVVAEARLQDAITGPARATVTSVAGVASEVVAVSCYAVLLIGATWWSAATLTAMLGLPMLAAAVATARWLPGPGLSAAEIRQEGGRRHVAPLS